MSNCSCRIAIGCVFRRSTLRFLFIRLLIYINLIRVIFPRTKNLHTRAHHPTDKYHNRVFYLKCTVHYNDDRLPKCTNHRHPYSYFSKNQHTYVHLSMYIHLSLQYGSLSIALRMWSHLTKCKFLYRVSSLGNKNHRILSHLSRFQLLRHVIDRLCSDLRILNHSNVCIQQFHLLYCLSIGLRVHHH